MHITVAGKQVETGEALKTHVREGLTQCAWIKNEAVRTFPRNYKCRIRLSDRLPKDDRRVSLSSVRPEPEPDHGF